MSDRQSAPPRDLGPWGIGFIALNAMIGAGIFGLPGKLDAALGAFAPVILLFAGLAMMLIALCYADLAARFDASGGVQLYTSSAFGEFAGFEVGWMYWASRVAATAANASILGTYASALLPAVPPGVIAAGAIIMVTSLNLARISQAVAALGLLTLLKLAPLLLVAALALANFGAAAPVVLPEFGAVEGVLLAALYALVGFEASTVPAGETRDPQRTIPRALLATLALTTAIYVLVQLAYSGSALGASDTPLASLATLTLGPWGSLLIAAAATVSTLGNLSCALSTMPRVTAAMADQRQLPALFGARSATGAPHLSVLVYGALALALAVSGTFVFLAVVSTLARLFVYALCALAIPVLDHRAGAPARPWRGFLLPAAVIVFCLWAASQSGGNEWLTFGAFLLAGTALFALARATARRG